MSEEGMRSPLPVFAAQSILRRELGGPADRVVDRLRLPARFPFGLAVVKRRPDVHQSHTATLQLEVAGRRAAGMPMVLMKAKRRRSASTAASSTCRRPSTLVRNSGAGSRSHALVSTTQ